jgi:hypothetical protein
MIIKLFYTLNFFIGRLTYFSVQNNSLLYQTVAAPLFCRRAVDPGRSKMNFSSRHLTI